MTEQKAGFKFAFEPIGDRLIGFFQQFGDVFQMLPEIGPHRHDEILVAVPLDHEPVAGLALGQRRVFEHDFVTQATDEHTAIIGVVDPKVQFEILLQQLGLDHLDLEQPHLGFLIAADHPGGAAGEQ